MSLRPERLTPTLAPAWDAYVLAHRDGWWWHTSGWITYQVAYRAGNEDHSFAVLDDADRVVGIVPIIAHTTSDGVREFSYSGDPAASALADDVLVIAYGATCAQAVHVALGARLGLVAASPFAP